MHTFVHYYCRDKFQITPFFEVCILNSPYFSLCNITYRILLHTTRVVAKRRVQSVQIAPLEEQYHNSKNTTFQERGKTTGLGDAIALKE
jgi:hypothetical protein